MRARYYDSSSGRFISEDPDQQDGNSFTYCRSSPVNGFDRSGKEAIGFFIAVLLFEAFSLFGWHPDDAATKCIKMLLDSAALASAGAQLWCQIGAGTDELGSKGALYLAVSSGVTAICFLVAAEQIVLLAMLANMDTDDDSQLDRNNQLMGDAGKVVPSE